MTKNQQQQVITIPSIERRLMKLRIRGLTSLIVHNFGEKAKRELAGRQTNAPRAKKQARNPQSDYEESLYVISKGKYGFPCSAIKSAAVNACRYLDGINMTYAKGAFYVLGDLFEIEKRKPAMRTDYVRLPAIGRPADMRYRGEFASGWEGELHVQYSPAAITPDSVVNLINHAGFHVGLGEWRPEKNGGGTHGMFEVVPGKGEQ